MHLDAGYYISRVLIPPLERIFNLVGANVRAWYDEMPRTIKADKIDPITSSPQKTRKEASNNRFKIDEHFQSSKCLVCGDVAPGGEQAFWPEALIAHPHCGFRYMRFLLCKIRNHRSRTASPHFEGGKSTDEHAAYL